MSTPIYLITPRLYACKGNTTALTAGSIHNDVYGSLDCRDTVLAVVLVDMICLGVDVYYMLEALEVKLLVVLVAY